VSGGARSSILAAVALVAATLSGCAAPAPADNTQPEATAVSDLNGEWQLTKASDADGALAVNGIPVTLAIADDSASGQAPCNSYTGEVDIDGDSVEFGTIAQTLMACTDDARTELETRYLAALEEVSGSTLTDETLTLTGDSVTLQFTLLPKKSITR
jgi:heat shock protein HslJ